MKSYAFVAALLTSAAFVPIDAHAGTAKAPVFAYVTNGDSRNVSVINSATNAVVGDIPVGNTPEGVAVTPDGRFAYVASFTDNPETSNERKDPRRQYYTP